MVNLLKKAMFSCEKLATPKHYSMLYWKLLEIHVWKHGPHHPRLGDYIVGRSWILSLYTSTMCSFAFPQMLPAGTAERPTLILGQQVIVGVH